MFTRRRALVHLRRENGHVHTAFWTRRCTPCPTQRSRASTSRLAWPTKTRSRRSSSPSLTALWLTWAPWKMQRRSDLGLGSLPSGTCRRRTSGGGSEAAWCSTGGCGWSSTTCCCRTGGRRRTWSTRAWRARSRACCASATASRSPTSTGARSTGGSSTCPEGVWAGREPGRRGGARVRGGARPARDLVPLVTHAVNPGRAAWPVHVFSGTRSRAGRAASGDAAEVATVAASPRCPCWRLRGCRSSPVEPQYRSVTAAGGVRGSVQDRTPAVLRPRHHRPPLALTGKVAPRPGR